MGDLSTVEHLGVRTLVAVAVSGLIVGCSTSGAEQPEAAAPGSSPASSPASAPASAGATTDESDCAVEGFVPTTKVTVNRSRPVAVYGARRTLAPDGSMSARNDQLDPVDPVRIQVRVDGREDVPRSVRTQILRTNGGPIENGKLADWVRGAYAIDNTTGRNRTYLVYRGARAYSGTWKVRGCGAPYNDGTTADVVTGTYSTVGKLTRVRVAGCGLPHGQTDLDRHAAQLACE